MSEDTCKIMADIKRCKNVMCGKIIYHYQESWKNGYCEEFCKEDNISGNIQKYNKTRKIETHYPHKDYPDTVLVIPANEQ